MIIRLTEQLDVPLREPNTLLLAAGYAPAYPQHGLDEPELSSVRAALRQVLAGHEPYPAVVINRWWEMLDGNAGVSLLVDGCAPWLLEPPVNVLRLSLHPDGMAPRILNLAQWRAHLLTQLQHRSRALGDERLMELHGELLGYPGGHSGLVSAHGAASPTGHRSPDRGSRRRPPGWKWSCQRSGPGAQWAMNCSAWSPTGLLDPTAGSWLLVWRPGWPGRSGRSSPPASQRRGRHHLQR
jgi:hypothetical protein